MIYSASDLIIFASVLNNILCSVVGCLFLLQIRSGLSGYQRLSASYFFLFFLLLGSAFFAMAIRSWVPLGYSVLINNALYMSVAYLLLFGTLSWYKKSIKSWLWKLAVSHVLTYTIIQFVIYYNWTGTLQFRVQLAFFNFILVYLAACWVCYKNRHLNGRGERMLALSAVVCMVAASFPTIALGITNSPDYYRVAVVVTQNIVCFFLLGSLLSLFLFKQIDWHYERSIRDELTGLYNRRYINERISQSLSSTGSRGVIAVVDIDHFKKVNDSFGHDVGDNTLIAVSNILKSFMGQQDLIGRYGGEEFVLFLSQSDSESVKTLLEEIRKAVETKASLMLPNPVTISVGYSEVSNGDTLHSLFSKADSALYMAKRNGRNCIIKK
ncbi:diguanylate cyclase (GGDEF)-like protein [Vibrio diazotrophicus]|uniref:diguanylate cyclase n=2 Tax=Vibrio diazotrophicus TaxID=685 RepID=A0A329E4Z4_VIBDI|nr:diguanylate cyclase (GGDEF)-like protein [Vibrio diazotrophicus]